MPITVRAKFRCTEETKTAWNQGGRRLVFEPIYDPDLPEDQRFCVATPSGRLEMQVDNPSAPFEVGEYYYLDLTSVDTEADQAVAGSAS
jgi:hypothetical protein